MASVRIAQFNHSETGGVWGEPGDQLKVPGTYETARTFHGELEIIPWYGPWEYVFRIREADKARRLANIAEQTCRNPAVGYSQNNGSSPRTSFYDELQAAGWDPSKIAKKCNGDCSAGMAAWLNAVGVQIDRNMWTGSEKFLLEQSGWFLTLSDDTWTEIPDYLCPGDILLKLGHTCLVLDYGEQIRSTIPAEVTADMWQRMTPDVKGKKTGSVKKGCFIDVMLPLKQSKWYIVSSGGWRGWSSQRCYSWEFEVTICGYEVNVRKRPSLNGEICGVVFQGAVLPYTGISVEDDRGVTWYQISQSNTLGWVSSMYATLGGYV